MNKIELKEKLSALLSETPEASKYTSTYLELLFDKNQFYSTDQLMEWFKTKRVNCTMTLNEIDVKDLKGWKTLPSGNIVHQSGEFYSIMGVQITNADREVQSWDQPMVYQKEMGVLGIITTLVDDVRYYILHAKAEPGNIHKLQLSPTLQATYSNLDRVHGGKKTLYANYFEKLETKRVLYKQWLAEDGGRFYIKSNLNVLLDVPDFDLKTLNDDYRPFTLSQIKHFLNFDQLINPHVRSIISHL